jgi:hypothetical protein
MSLPRNHDHERRRELAVVRYVAALEAGDAEEVGRILAEAESDPELDRLLAGVDSAMHEEAGLPPLADSAQIVRALLMRFLPSAFPPQGAVEAVEIGEIASRIQTDEIAYRGLSAADRMLNQRLRGDRTPAPTSITAATVAELAGRLGGEGSPRYWDLFRRTGLVLAIARQHDRIELAAARQRSPQRRRRTRSDESTT